MSGRCSNTLYSSERTSIILDKIRLFNYIDPFKFDFSSARNVFIGESHALPCPGAIRSMNLEKLLSEKKRNIVDRWFNAVIDTYAPDTALIFKSQRDRFANPVGVTVRDGLAAIFDALIEGRDPDQSASLLDPLIRIRAVQKFTPSQATGFIFFLKKIIRDILRHKLSDKQSAQLLHFEDRIDTLALTAFDIYMECKEKIYDLKTSQERNSIYRAFKRAGLITEIAEDEPNLNVH